MRCVGETFRATLNSLAIVAPAWLHSFAPQEWHARYDHRVEEHGLPPESPKRAAVAEIIGADGYHLLTAIESTQLVAPCSSSTALATSLAPTIGTG